MSKAILVVDDVADLAQICAELLASEGYRCIHTSTVTDAMKVLADVQIDLVLTDMFMPGQSGFDLRDHIRNDKRLIGIPIVFMTGRIDQAENTNDIVLLKPFGMDVLLRTLDKVLQKPLGN